MREKKSQYFSDDYNVLLTSWRKAKRDALNHFIREKHHGVRSITPYVINNNNAMRNYRRIVAMGNDF